jgi:hypothetical protein
MATSRIKTGGAPYCPLNKSDHSLGIFEFPETEAF